MGVASTKVQSRKSSLLTKGVGSISSSNDSRWQSNASTGADLRHVGGIEFSGCTKVSILVVNSKVGSLVGLERKLNSRGNHHGSLQNTSTVGCSLGLVDIELGVGELGADLGRKGSSLTSLGLDSHSNGTSILLTLERSLGGVVVVQKVCVMVWKKVRYDWLQ